MVCCAQKAGKFAFPPVRDIDMLEEIRQAVSLVLRRPDSDAVYLVHRNPQLRFFGDFWAFPGGALQPQDGQLVAAVRGEHEPQLAPYRVAAAREGLEELGLSLCDRPFTAVERQALLENPQHFAALLAQTTHIGADALPPWIRLRTPPFSPIRFDTCFLLVDLARLAHESEPAILPGELIDGAWDGAANWLRRWRRGEILIAPPVLLLLEIVERHGFAGAAPELQKLEREFDAGALHPIFYNPALQLMPLLTPTMPPATHTNACLIGVDPAYLIDPATPHLSEQERLLSALSQARDRGRRLVAILLTHHHSDHVGAAGRLRRELGLPVWAHRRTAELLGSQLPIDRQLADGERLPLGIAPDGKAGWELECIFTPGHAAGHLCFLESRYGSLVCGDMMSTLSSILIHPDDGDMAQYMDSLQRLAARPDVRMVIPAHGPATASGQAALRGQWEHRRQREAAILDAVTGGARDLAGIVSSVYRDVPTSMHGLAALSVRSVLRKLRQEGRLSAEVHE